MGKTILTTTQQQVLTILSENTAFTENFYFTGGTVLAEYYLKHRFSEDLDFFSSVEVDKIWLTSVANKIKSSIKSSKLDIQESFNRNLVYFHFNQEVLKTEFTYFPFSNIETPKKIHGIKIDSSLDIAVNKFFTIYQKPTSRHFIDLYLLIIRKMVKWEELPKLARIKFDTVIDPLQLGSQLISVTEAKDMPRMVTKLKDQEWKNFFIEKAKELKSKIQK